MKKCLLCSKATVGRGYCKKHYRAFMKYGDPLYKINMRGVPLEERVVVDEDTGCLLWVGSTDTCGYGIIHAEGQHTAHRVSYTRYVKPIPAGAHVLHTCDRPACIAPEHLFLGTHAMNMADMVAKGRSRGAIGSINASAKLTESQAVTIMQDERTCEDIAREYGISPTSVDMIRNGRTWKHVFKKKYKATRQAAKPALSRSQVSQIKKDPRTQMEIAAAFGTSQSTVSLIKRGKHR